MYYDTRPTVFNGAFDFYTYEKLKGYYPFYWYGMFYDMAAEVRSQTECENIYYLCGVDKHGKALLALTYYTEKDDCESKTVSVEFNKKSKYEIYLVDKENSNTLVDTTDELCFDMKPHTCVLIKEI
jgi:hypothetical protein